jgi:hypothetical protein
MGFILILLFIVMFIQLFKMNSKLERKNIFNRGYYYLIILSIIYVCIKLVYIFPTSNHSMQ